MPASPQNPDSLSPGAGQFTATHWSIVLAAGRNDSTQARGALETLCRSYWFPLYTFVRRQGYNAQDAQDLTQAFFARLLEKHALGAVDRAKGKAPRDMTGVPIPRALFAGVTSYGRKRERAAVMVRRRPAR